MENKGTRLGQILSIIKKHKLSKQMSPQKLRMLIEDLGPTYIKLGQLMSLHSDILPKEYCDELMKLTAHVEPMDPAEMEYVLNESYPITEEYPNGWNSHFSHIDEMPIGAASIAQVHRAVLTTGERVTIKIRRKGIYEIMDKDIRLLKHVSRLIPPIGYGSIKRVVSIRDVLDEMWRVAKEEMDFETEAKNTLEMTANQAGLNYIYVPKLYTEHCTRSTLVSEYIEGCGVDDCEALTAGGYDLEEIGAKLIDNYLKQIIEDGFFHADPHPGNIKVSGGKIVWLDMGMMGRFNDNEKRMLTEGVRGIAEHDILRIENALLSIGEAKRQPDKDQLYKDLKDIIGRYGSAGMASIDVAEFLQDIIEVMKDNGIRIPRSMTLLARGLTHMEGVLTKISPDINMVEIAITRIQANPLDPSLLKDELHDYAAILARSVSHGAKIPILLSNILKEYSDGQSRINMSLRADRNTAWLLRKIAQNLVIGMWVMALLISSAILCTTDITPKIIGIPYLAFIGFLIAALIALYLVIRHFISKK